MCAEPKKILKNFKLDIGISKNQIQTYYELLIINKS